MLSKTITSKTFKSFKSGSSLEFSEMGSLDVLLNIDEKLISTLFTKEELEIIELNRNEYGWRYFNKISSSSSINFDLIREQYAESLFIKRLLKLQGFKIENSKLLNKK
ncbi:hypothetical protein [Mesoplasma coleopterae]|uniref:hypothetical protein n=1 Tax=Mesoplasma coleopterae TaxID=324078 RepID=UPI000D026E50|nr:hypothetical protein [Mesoplasma coleopterae]AVN62709.1 hypothetical protein CG000_00055 [Mesoplasma coleopterae]